ncbi:MAG: iron ABC transporter permease [Gammaproteobacteria bacterium]|nr:iron ABC transporter permease [Gammaproteobacteria bacterium]
MPNNLRLLLGLLLATPLGLLAALASGSAALAPTELWQVLTGAGEPLQQSLIFDLRLPRALAALICGGLLALAGALIQVLLRNPLGDPYVLGISGGASVGALAALLLNSPLLPLTPTAALGAFVSLLLVFGLTGARGWSIQRLLLTGVVIAAGWGALISLVLSLSPSERLPGMLFWLMGDLSRSQDLLGPGLILLGGLLIGLLLAPQLNLLLQGELQAATLGVEVRRLRIILFLLSSVLTASAVTLAGSIGFIGLVAPHLFRLIGGSDHRLLLPGALLIGGLLLLFADTLARSLIAPQQLPLGALTALIGVPLFLYLLNRR